MLRGKTLFLFDIDGTLSIGSEWIDGAQKLLDNIAARGGTSLFITNNSTKSRPDYVRKFTRMGRREPEDRFVTASYVTARFLAEQFPGKTVFALGTRSFLGELRAFGVDAVETLSPGIAAAVAGYDSELTYRKAALLCGLLQTRVLPYFATNGDLACPAPFGFIPDCGAICRMIADAAGKRPLVLGKPNPMMAEICLRQTGCTREQTLIIGDRLSTDIALGINAGIDACLVLTGEAKRGDLLASPWRPAFVFESVRELASALI